MGIFSRRDTQLMDARDARVTIARIFQLRNKDLPYKDSPAERRNQERKTTRGPRGWL